jgi:hypothetical protein
MNTSRLNQALQQDTSGSITASQDLLQKQKKETSAKKMHDVEKELSTIFAKIALADEEMASHITKIELLLDSISNEHLLNSESV